MARNPVQFQKGISLNAFLSLYGTEDQCFDALYQWRWPVPALATMLPTQQPRCAWAVQSLLRQSRSIFAMLPGPTPPHPALPAQGALVHTAMQLTEIAAWAQLHLGTGTRAFRRTIPCFLKLCALPKDPSNANGGRFVGCRHSA